MKCPKCGGGLGFKSALSTSPGKPFACKSCACMLKIDTRRAGMVAVAALLLCMVPFTGLIPDYLVLFWVIAVCGAAFYAYVSLAAPYDPDAVLSFRARGGLFEVLPEGIRYGNQLYSYADVLHLSRYASKTSFNFIPMVEFLRIRVHFKGVKAPVTLQNRLGLIMTTSGLQEIYIRLAEKTFAARVRRYLSQLERKAHFEFGGARFHGDGKVSFGEKQLDLHSAKLSLEPFKLVIDPPGMFNRKRKVDTETDQDVLLALIEKLYGITFRA